MIKKIIAYGFVLYNLIVIFIYTIFNKFSILDQNMFLTIALQLFIVYFLREEIAIAKIRKIDALKAALYYLTLMLVPYWIMYSIGFSQLTWNSIVSEHLIQHTFVIFFGVMISFSIFSKFKIPVHLYFPLSTLLLLALNKFNRLILYYIKYKNHSQFQEYLPLDSFPIVETIILTIMLFLFIKWFVNFIEYIRKVHKVS